MKDMKFEKEALI